MNIDLPKRNIFEDIKIDIKVNQQNLPLGNYTSNVYKFPENFYYSGYIYNASIATSLNIQISLSSGENLPIISIPPNAILKIKNLKIYILNISSGYYTYSFLGSNIFGIPELEIDPQNMFVYREPYSTNGKIYSAILSLNSTGVTYPLPDNFLVFSITIKADKNNTASVELVAQGTTSGYELEPGESITLYMVNPSQLGFSPASSGQTVYVIYGGTNSYGGGIGTIAYGGGTNATLSAYVPTY